MPKLLLKPNENIQQTVHWLVYICLQSVEFCEKHLNELLKVLIGMKGPILSLDSSASFWHFAELFRWKAAVFTLQSFLAAVKSCACVLAQVWPARSRGVCCTTWRWSRWPRRPKLWWRQWATSRLPSPAPHIWSTSGPCSRYRRHTHTGTYTVFTHKLHTSSPCRSSAGMDTLPGSFQRGSPGLRWHRGGLAVSGGHPLCHQDSVHLLHTGTAVLTGGLVSLCISYLAVFWHAAISFCLSWREMRTCRPWRGSPCWLPALASRKWSRRTLTPSRPSSLWPTPMATTWATPGTRFALLLAVFPHIVSTTVYHLTLSLLFYSSNEPQ